MAHPMCLTTEFMAFVSCNDIEVYDLLGTTPQHKYTLKGHSDLVTKIILADDLLVSCSNDHTAKTWSLSTGELKATLRGHAAAVSNVFTFNTTADYALTVSHDNLAILWNIGADAMTAEEAQARNDDEAKEAEAGETPTSFQEGDIAPRTYLKGHTAMINTVAISAGDRQIVTGGEDCSVRVWNSLGHEKYKFTTEQGVVDMVFIVAEDCPHLCVATYGAQLECYAMNTMESVGVVAVHSKPISSLAKSPDGGLVICGSADGRGSMVTIQNGQLVPLAEFGTDGGNPMVAVAINPMRYEVAYADGTAVRMFDLESKQISTSLEGMLSDVRRVLYSKDGRLIIASAEGEVRAWTIDGELVAHETRKQRRHSTYAVDASAVVDGGEGFDVPHLMISYNWGHQDIVKKLNAALKQRGYKVWIDIEQMGGSTLGAMAEAVDGAAAILMCVSDKYSKSPNCRAEAEYSFTTKKRIIPLMMETNFGPKGWLGFILGSKLWTAFWEDLVFEEQMDLLCKEIGDLGMAGAGAPKPAAPAAAAPSGPSQNEKVAAMTVDDVVDWLLSVTSSEAVASKCKDHDIDGNALLCLKSIAMKDELAATKFFQESFCPTLGDALRLTRSLQGKVGF